MRRIRACELGDEQGRDVGCGHCPRVPRLELRRRGFSAPSVENNPLPRPFRLDVLPFMGIRTAVVQCFITSAEMPECSSPSTRQVGASPPIRGLDVAFFAHSDRESPFGSSSMAWSMRFTRHMGKRSNAPADDLTASSSPVQTRGGHDQRGGAKALGRPCNGPGGCGRPSRRQGRRRAFGLLEGAEHHFVERLKFDREMKATTPWWFFMVMRSSRSLGTACAGMSRARHLLRLDISSVCFPLRNKTRCMGLAPWSASKTG